MSPTVARVLSVARECGLTVATVARATVGTFGPWPVTVADRGP